MLAVFVAAVTASYGRWAGLDTSGWWQGQTTQWPARIVQPQSLSPTASLPDLTPDVSPITPTEKDKGYMSLQSPSDATRLPIYPPAVYARSLTVIVLLALAVPCSASADEGAPKYKHTRDWGGAIGLLVFAVFFIFWSAMIFGCMCQMSGRTHWQDYRRMEPRSSIGDIKSEWREARKARWAKAEAEIAQLKGDELEMHPPRAASDTPGVINVTAATLAGLAVAQPAHAAPISLWARDDKPADPGLGRGWADKSPALRTYEMAVFLCFLSWPIALLLLALVGPCLALPSTLAQLPRGIHKAAFQCYAATVDRIDTWRWAWARWRARRAKARADARAEAIRKRQAADNDKASTKSGWSIASWKSNMPLLKHAKRPSTTSSVSTLPPYPGTPSRSSSISAASLVGLALAPTASAQTSSSGPSKASCIAIFAVGLAGLIAAIGYGLHLALSGSDNVLTPEYPVTRDREELKKLKVHWRCARKARWAHARAQFAALESKIDAQLRREAEPEPAPEPDSTSQPTAKHDKPRSKRHSSMASAPLVAAVAFATPVKAAPIPRNLVAQFGDHPIHMKLRTVGFFLIGLWPLVLIIPFGLCGLAIVYHRLSAWLAGRAFDAYARTVDWLDDYRIARKLRSLERRLAEVTADDAASISSARSWKPWKVSRANSIRSIATVSTLPPYPGPPSDLPLRPDTAVPAYPTAEREGYSPERTSEDIAVFGKRTAAP
jgi:hypothetical protein